MASIHWTDLQHITGEIPWPAIDEAVEAVVEDPGQVQPLQDRFREITADSYVIATFEYAYIPYILSQAARRLPAEQAAAICAWIIDEIIAAGMLDDDGAMEHLMFCGIGIGPRIAGPTLDRFETDVRSADDEGWFHLWGLLETVEATDDQAVRDRFVRLATRVLQQALEVPEQYEDAGFAAFLLADLKVKEAEPLLEKLAEFRAPPEAAHARREYREALRRLRDEEERTPGADNLTPRESVERTWKALKEWYRTRPADWNEGEEYDEPVLSEPFFDDEPPDRQLPVRYSTAKVGRNDPCPCGSGKKYKKCCGK